MERVGTSGLETISVEQKRWVHVGPESVSWFWVGAPTSDDSRLGSPLAKSMLDDLSGAHDVVHREAARDEAVGDERAVTSPRQRLGAHERDARRLRPGGQVGKCRSEIGRA